MTASNRTPLIEPDLSVHDQRLRATLKFNEDDLAENRLGDISLTQQQRLYRTTQFERFLAIFAVGLFPVVIHIALTERRGLTGAQLSARTTDIVCGGPLISISLMAALVFFDTLFRRWNTKARKGIPQEQVITLTGPVRKLYEHKGRAAHDLLIWNKTIRISQDEFNSFSDGQIYTVYQDAVSKRLIAAEWVDQSQPINPNTALRWAFGFGSKDLEENRQGWISARQKTALSTEPSGYRWVLLIASGVLLLSLSLVSYWWGSDIMRTVMLLLFAGIGYLDCVFVVKRLALWRGRVEAIRGRVTSQGLTLSVDGDDHRVFAFDGRIAAFIPGEIYTLYYMPYKTLFFDHFDPILGAVYHLPDQPEQVTGEA